MSRNRHRHPPHPNPPPVVPPLPPTNLKKHYLQLKEHAELLFGLLLPDQGALESDIDIIADLITKNTPHDGDLVDWAQKLVENGEFKDIELNLADPILLLLVVVRQILADRRKEAVATAMKIVLGTPTSKA